MSGFVPYAFSEQQKADIRRFCGFPIYGDGNVVFPFPWIMRQYLALEWRLNHMSQVEGNILATNYIAPLYAMEAALNNTGANLDTESAGPWKHNANEHRDRIRLFDDTRRRLCGFLGISPGPDLGEGGMRVIV